MRPTGTTPGDGIEVRTTLARAEMGLRSWGWPVVVVGTSVLLETRSGFCGVETHHRLGEAVLRLLRDTGAEGPVVRVPAPAATFVFLAEADALVDAESLQRAGATLLQGDHKIPLPSSSADANRTSWVVAPRPDRRWLPSLSTIAWALEAVTPA